MLTSLHGRIEQNPNEQGFVMLRELLVLLVVIICAAIVLNAFMVFVHQSGKIMNKTEQTIKEQNYRLEKLVK